MKLIIADTHVTVNHLRQEVLDVLVWGQSVNANIVGAGDIADYYACRDVFQSDNWHIFNALFGGSVWVGGNHDWLGRTQKDYSFISGDKPFTVMHGHQFDPNLGWQASKLWKWLLPLFAAGCGAVLTRRRFLKMSGSGIGVMMLPTFDMVSRMKQWVDDDHQSLIVGHVHWPEPHIELRPNGHYFIACGDYYEHNNGAVVIENGIPRAWQ